MIKLKERATRKTEAVFEDGEWWYIRPEGTKTAGKRERIDQYHKNNDVREQMEWPSPSLLDLVKKIGY